METLTIQTENNETKKATFNFTIEQSDFKYAFALQGDKTKMQKSNPELIANVTKQICGRLYSLMLIRKQSGQKLGLNLSNNFDFSFEVSGKEVNTHTVREALNLSLKIGSSSVKRQKFEMLLNLIIAEMLRGNNLYTAKEIQELSTKLEAHEILQAQAVKALKQAKTV